MGKVKTNSGYIHGLSGSSMDVPCPGQWHVACCDCGLDHLFLLEPKGKGKISITVYRDDYMTVVHRKSRKHTCRPKR